MKQRTSSSRSNVRARGSMSTRRSRSALPATTRRPKSSTAKRKSTASRSRRSSGRSSASARTTDHQEIRKWVEAHGGTPSIVKGTSKAGQGGGILRIDFPGFSGEKSLRKVSWNQWFKIFDQRKLAFLHQKSRGKQGRFNKLVSRGK